MPSGKIRTADIADLARANQIVERTECLFNRSQCIEAMKLVEIDVVRPQPFQTSFDRGNQMLPRRADIIQRPAVSKRAFSGNQDLVSSAFHGLAQYSFRHAGGVDVRRIEHANAGIETDIHESRCLCPHCCRPTP